MLLGSGVYLVIRECKNGVIVDWMNSIRECIKCCLGCCEVKFVEGYVIVNVDTIWDRLGLIVC